MKTKKEDILWKINSPDTLQLWPKSSRECYISPPFLPEEFVSDANGIFAPKDGSLDILGLYGIKNAAFTTHRSQYYSERVKKKFPTIIYTLRGTAKKFPCRAPSAYKLAKSLSISVYELNKACCKIKSRSYAGILSDAKMRIAADKISEGLPLSECAKIAGYSNIFALSKAFKRRYGISPSKFAGKT